MGNSLAIGAGGGGAGGGGGGGGGGGIYSGMLQGPSGTHIIKWIL